MITLKELLIRNAGDKDIGIISELIGAFPEASIIPAKTMQGYEYETLVRTKRGGAAFRKANNGSDPAHDTVELRKVQTFIIERLIQADKAVADRNSEGPAAFIAEQEVISLEAVMESLGLAFYYGQTEQSVTNEDGDAVGMADAFPGLVKAIDSAFELTAGGASNKTSVFAIRAAKRGVQMVLGGNRTLTLPDEYRTQHVTGANGKQMPAYCGELTFYPGLQAVVKHSQARIKNIDSSASSTKPLTAALMDKLEALAPSGRPWTHYLMTKSSQTQLHTDAIAKLGGLNAWPKKPDNWNGIPIITTDSISLAETV